MLPTDQSHLRKYLATLGVAIVAGAISASLLALRVQDDLLVKEAELAELTPSARETIERRQQFAEAATTLVPWILAVGIASGLTVTAFGLVGWAHRQKVIDDIEDANRDRVRHELRQLSEPERQNKLSQEAVESVAVQEAAPVVAALERVSHLRNVLLARLAAIFGSGRVQSDVVMDGPPYRIEVDFVASRAKSSTYVIDFIYSATGEVTKRVQQAARSVREFSDVIGFARPCIIVVVPDEFSSQVDRIRNTIRDAAYHLALLVATESELVDMTPADFAGQLGMPAPVTT